MHDHPNITLDLEDFTAPDLTHIVGNETLDIYNWNFEKEYDSHESGSPIGTVRDIYNSRIVVSRPHDPLDSEYHNIGYIYGDMAFCEIELTSTSAECKCIGEVMPGARICDTNTLSSCPVPVSTVSCQGIESAPLVTMDCPGSSVIDHIGSSRAFSATISAASWVTVTFIPDGKPLEATTIPIFRRVAAGEEITFTIETFKKSKYVGTHTIKVVATNDFGSGIATCEWTLRPKWKEIFMECSGPSKCGMPPTFTALIDREALIEFYVLDDAHEVVATKSDTGSSLSFTLEGIEPGTYTVLAAAKDGLEISDTARCSGVVVEDSLRICRDIPDREIVIDTLFNGKASHFFRAETNRSDATMKLYIVNLADDSKELFAVTGPTPTNPDSIEASFPVNEAGIYRVTATAEFQNESVSVSWDWVVSEEVIGSCSTVFLNGGSYIDKGLYIHLCESDMEYWFRFSPSIPTAISLIPSTLEGLLLLGDLIRKSVIKLTGRAALKVIGNLMTILSLGMVTMYAFAHNEDDLSLDIFIPTTSLLLIPLAISPVLPPIPIRVRIGKHDRIVWL